MENKYVIIRTFSAGVHIGILKSRNGMEVILTNSRRIWYWSGAASLSQMAIDGVLNQNACKFSVEVPEILLTEAIEIIPTTPNAEANLKGVPIWKT